VNAGLTGLTVGTWLAVLGRVAGLAGVAGSRLLRDTAGIGLRSGLAARRELEGACVP
jgi:hypothetical protein